MRQVYESKELCCGCGACEAICPQNVISMKLDECGFLYPEIIEELCVDCGLCQEVCVYSKPNNYSEFRECYVAKHKLSSVVDKSRSGGFFTAISDIILDMDGIVYGAKIDEQLKVYHTKATTKDTRDEFRGSKYVQSNLQGVFEEICMDLSNEKYVLFTGTSCQCEGLKSFLETRSIPTDKLLICDIVCHSSASPEIFSKYIEYQENKYKSKIVEFDFRDKKKFSWGEHVERIKFENGKTLYTDEYTNLFYDNDIRPACYNCKYASLKRVTDITLADCWGGQRVYPDLVNKKGASLVLINTEKGKIFFDKARETMEVRPIDIEEVMQPRLLGPEEKLESYDEFWDDYKTLDFETFIKRHSLNQYTIVNTIKRLIKKVFKKLRKILRY